MDSCIACSSTVVTTLVSEGTQNVAEIEEEKIRKGIIVRGVMYNDCEGNAVLPPCFCNERTKEQNAKALDNHHNRSDVM